MIHTIRFILIFFILSIIVGFYTWAGLEPSRWTVLIVLAVSGAIAYATKPVTP